VGEVFSWSSVAAIVPPDVQPRVGPLLQALVRKELIRPVLGSARSEDRFRFGHILVRDAAYAGLPKDERAELHEQVAHRRGLLDAPGDRPDEGRGSSAPSPLRSTQRDGNALRFELLSPEPPRSDPPRSTKASAFAAQLAAQSDGDRTAEALVQIFTAYLEALDGSFADARARVAAAAPELEERGKRILLASTQRLFAGQLELLASDPAAAEDCFRDGYRKLEALGEHSNLAGLTAYLAAAVRAQGRHDEADELAAAAARDGNPDDAEVQILWRLTHARVRAAGGRVDEGERLAQEAVAIAQGTDVPSLRADAFLALAAVRRCTHGNGAAAAEAAREALALYRAKGNRAGMREVQALLASDSISVG
jgi:hypothetical protein